MLTEKNVDGRITILNMVSAGDIIVVVTKREIFVYAENENDNKRKNIQNT